MPKSPLIEWSPPEDFSRAFRLVGEFLFWWSHLERDLNKSLHELLSLKGPEALIATATMSLRDKTTMFRALVNFYGVGQDWQATAREAIARVEKLSAERNVVAHNTFGPHDDGGVEFYLIKTKGSGLEMPELVWSIEDFLHKNSEMKRLGEDLVRLSKAASTHKRLIHILARRDREGVANALAPPVPPATGMSLLDLLDIFPASERVSSEAGSHGVGVTDEGKPASST